MVSGCLTSPVGGLDFGGTLLGNGRVRAAGNLLLVVGEGRVDVRAVGVEGARAGVGGVVFGCLGAGWLLGRCCRRGVSEEGS